jgi:hypothetical protein
MGFSYTWNDLTNRVRTFVRNLPVGNDWTICCDMVAGQMYTAYPWKESLQNIAATLLPLVDGKQDYSVPTNIYRFTKLSLVRTDVNPDVYREIDVADDLDIDLNPRSWGMIRSGCLQGGFGTLRLDSAVAVPTGQTIEIQGVFQINPNKVSALTDGMFFKDQYVNVAFAGLLHYAYRLNDDDRAGTAQTTSQGQIAYTGQLGIFMAGLEQMKSAEAFGSIDTYYPETSMGAGRLTGNGTPFPFGGY